LGEVFTHDTRFTFPGDPPSWLRPGVAFVSSARLPRDAFSRGYSRRIPDFIVEVVSPSNTEAEIFEKIAIYLTHGVRLIWLVRPVPQTVTVFRPDTPEVVVGADGVLDGGEVLPGFTLPLSDIFRRPRGTALE
jgi:Uma2 family endonuclease